MAETAVNLVIDMLIPLLVDEVKLLIGVDKEIKSIQEELKLMQAYLKDADEKAERSDSSSEVVKTWVKQTRELAYRTEDVIDEHLFKVAKSGQRHVEGFLYDIAHSAKTAIVHHKIKSEIDSIKALLIKRRERTATFGFASSQPEVTINIPRADSSEHISRRGAHITEDAPLLGVDETKEILTGWLSKEERMCIVFSAVGQGGLGKTTIVNNVYEKQKEKKSFDCYAWITVSSLKRAEPLSKTMMRSFYQYDRNAAIEIKGVDNDTLKSKLREYLQERRYMIVFDDVWNREFWRNVIDELPKNDKRSRIIITTRDKGVAQSFKRFAPLHIHELQPLPLKEASSLFYLTAFQFDKKDCPEELKKISEDFVKKSDGVPLAVVEIAGLLSTKRKNVCEWQRVYDNLRSELASNPHLRGFFEVLSKSYNDLPYHLKSCLLYFGLFPKNYSISCVRLINLWIAEGFVKQTENKNDQTLEEVAEDYLNELIDKGLVKVSENYPYDRVRRCQVHDLMHDFVLNKCEKLNFCQVIKNEGFEFLKWTRRLSILTNSIHTNLQRAANYEKVRSCFGFKLRELSKPAMQSFLSHFQLLKALELEDAPLDYLPEAVGKLLLLKYLNLRKTRIMTIPEFISKLLNLETLDLKHTRVSELSAFINQLVKLRHLIAYSSSHGVKLKKGVGCLKALQKLTKVDTTTEDGVIEGLIHMEQMRRLGIMKLRSHNGKSLCIAIERMKHLCSLSIAAFTENEVLDLHSITNPPQYLRRLDLDGRLEKLPNWIPKLRHLAKLHLSWSGLKEDPLFFLKDLTELVDLFLHSYEGEEFHLENGWFKKLKVLRLKNMQRLRRLRIDFGAMPLLEDLQLAFCPQMVQVPTDIQNLRALKFLHLEGMSEQFIKNTEEESCYTIFGHMSCLVTYFMDGQRIPI